MTRKRLTILSIGALFILCSPAVFLFSYAYGSDDGTDTCDTSSSITDTPLGSFTIKGQPATPEQRRNVAIALGEARRLHAPQLAVEAELVAGIGESSFIAKMNEGGSAYGGVFQGDVRHGVWAIDDTKGMADSFLLGGKGFQGGGAIALAKRGLSPGEIATTVEAGGAAPDFYGRYLPEARAILGLPTDAVDTAAPCTAPLTGDLSSIQGRAEALAAMQLPYIWGGHHGDVGPIGDPHPGLDCSSAVSWVLNIPPRVSGGFETFGDPGPGAVTIYANGGHVYMVINGVGYGTGSGPGHNTVGSIPAGSGGFGKLAYTSRPGFVVRHVPLNFDPAHVTGTDNVRGNAPDRSS